ncbi:MAG: hypothetical protein H0T41_13585 [Rhodobacteraceae bacterium]|nr:hypothetical protein [Paracoccaceae bacterium]
MTFKAVLILLALLLLAGMIGRSFAPRVDRPRNGRAVEAAQKCPACGAYALKGALCGRADCPRA